MSELLVPLVIGVTDFGPTFFTDGKMRSGQKNHDVCVTALAFFERVEALFIHKYQLNKYVTASINVSVIKK